MVFPGRIPRVEVPGDDGGIDASRRKAREATGRPFSPSVLTDWAPCAINTVLGSGLQLPCLLTYSGSLGYSFQAHLNVHNVYIRAQALASGRLRPYPSLTTYQPGALTQMA